LVKRKLRSSSSSSERTYTVPRAHTPVPW
jgi:hypothetical protein